MSEIPTHPVQVHVRPHTRAQVPQVVSLSAYEVYCAVFGPQPALVEGWCRGGFGLNELIAFLYAKQFPKNEWRKRVDEALQGMQGF